MQATFIGGPWDGKLADLSHSDNSTLQMFFGCETMHFYERGQDGNFYYYEDPRIENCVPVILTSPRVQSSS